MENKIFNQNITRNEINQIDSIDIFEKRTISSINNNHETSYFNSIDKDKLSGIFLQRESIKDGNSFYRMFMFGIIEYYILSKNLHEIKKILFDVN